MSKKGLRSTKSSAADFAISIISTYTKRFGKGPAKQRVADPAQAALFAAGVYLAGLLAFFLIRICLLMFVACSMRDGVMDRF